MKMTKSDFKGMIKDCIRELIKEGAFNEVGAVMSEGTRTAPSTNRVASRDMINQKSPVDAARTRAAAARIAGYDDMGFGSSENSDMQISSAPMNQNMPIDVKNEAMKAIIDLSADRGAYICQSQSLNIFMENANFGKLTSMHFYGWEKGLKTGMYYLRTKAATDAIKFTVDKTVVANTSPKTEEEIACAIDNEDDCEMCSG